MKGILDLSRLTRGDYTFRLLRILIVDETVRVVYFSPLLYKVEYKESLLCGQAWDFEVDLPGSRGFWLLSFPSQLRFEIRSFVLVRSFFGEVLMARWLGILFVAQMRRGVWAWGILQHGIAPSWPNSFGTSMRKNSPFGPVGCITSIFRERWFGLENLRRVLRPWSSILWAQGKDC